MTIHLLALVTALCCFWHTTLQAQMPTSMTMNDEISATEYVETYRIIAITEMKRTGIPASITLAQGIIESRHGNSRLARKANNHFGVKCRSDWHGGRAYQKDENPNECFRRYQTPIQSFVDHSTFLAANQRYAFLFLLDLHDYRGWANGLEEIGYSTSGHYAEKVTALIEAHQLYAYDMAGSKDDTLNLQIPEPSAYYKKYVQKAYTKKARNLGEAKFAGKVAVDKLHEFHRFNDDGTYEYVSKDTNKEIAMAQIAESFNDSSMTQLYDETFSETLPILGNAAPPDDHQLVLMSSDPTPRPTIAPYATQVANSTNPVAPDTASTLTIKYVVQQGDSLYAIAKQFSVSVNDIIQKNHLPNNSLKTGDPLLIDIK